MNNIRTFKAENRGIFKNSQLQIRFTGFYKKKCTNYQSPLSQLQNGPSHKEKTSFNDEGCLDLI